jgi:hypothetical protein
LLNTYAIIENEIVVNCIVADSDFIKSNYPKAIKIEDVSPQPCPGWSYKKGKFICPPQVEVINEAETI